MPPKIYNIFILKNYFAYKDNNALNHFYYGKKDKKTGEIIKTEDVERYETSNIDKIVEKLQKNKGYHLRINPNEECILYVYLVPKQKSQVLGQLGVLRRVASLLQVERVQLLLVGFSLALRRL